MWKRTYHASVFMLTIIVLLVLSGCSGGGKSPMSPDRDPSVEPGCPSSLTATGQDGAIKLEWLQPAVEPGYTYGYLVYRADATTVPFENPNGDFNKQSDEQVAETGLVEIAGEPVMTTQWTDSPVTNGQTFYYRVRIVKIQANKIIEKNHWSNEASAMATEGDGAEVNPGNDHPLVTAPIGPTGGTVEAPPDSPIEGVSVFFPEGALPEGTSVTRDTMMVLLPRSGEHFPDI